MELKKCGGSSWNHRSHRSFIVSFVFWIHPETCHTERRSHLWNMDSDTIPRGRCILLYRSDTPLCTGDYSQGEHDSVPRRKKERDRRRDTHVRPATR